MLRPFSACHRFALAARDGEIGAVDDLYFDDQSWVLRYVVVDTGGWLTGRKVLISPRALGLIDEDSKLIAVHLTRREVGDSPPIDTALPVSRQYEKAWHAHYGYPEYWTADPMGISPMIPFPADVTSPLELPARRESDSAQRHLRSVREIIGYEARAENGAAGDITDLLFDDEDWSVRYVVVADHGRHALLSPEWIVAVCWEERRLEFSLRREAVRTAPDWDPGDPVTREFEEEVFRHHQRGGYWLGASHHEMTHE